MNLKRRIINLEKESIKRGIAEKEKTIKWLKEELWNLSFEADFRICSECGAVLFEGFCIENDDFSYYCDKKKQPCLSKHLTNEQVYYTEWDYDPEITQLLTKTINNINSFFGECVINI